MRGLRQLEVLAAVSSSPCQRRGTESRTSFVQRLTILGACLAILGCVAFAVLLPDASVADALDPDSVEGEVIDDTYDRESERQRPWARDVTRDARRSSRRIGWILGLTIRTWTGWMARAFVFFGVAVLVVVLDRALLIGWKRDGLGALREGFPIRAFTYAVLVLDRQVPITAKAVLAAVLVYGIVGDDFVRDTFPDGYLDDLVLVALGTKWFVYRCSEDRVIRAANRALEWRERSRRIARQRATR